MKIFIIRHSETNANMERRIQGQLDYPLNERGIFLAKETGKALDYIKFKKAFTSPLDRAYQTCKLILEYSNNKDPFLGFSTSKFGI